MICCAFIYHRVPLLLLTHLSSCALANLRLYRPLKNYRDLIVFYAHRVVGFGREYDVGGINQHGRTAIG